MLLSKYNLKRGMYFDYYYPTMSQNNPEETSRQKDEIAGLFSRAASTYDQIGPRFFSYFGKRLIELAQIPRGARVLDVATGRGAVLIPAAEAVGQLGSVIGIDISEAMVLQTAAEITRLHLANAEVRQMDAENLQFSDGSFDGITCGFAIFFFPQLDRALAELRRVLKPNGLFALSSWDEAFNDNQWQWFEELYNQYIPKETEEEKSSGPPSSPEPDLTSEAGLRKVLENAGFDVTLIESETAEFFYHDVDEWWASFWSHGMRSSLELLQKKTGADGLERFRKDAFENAERYRQTAGIQYLTRAIYARAAKR